MRRGGAMFTYAFDEFGASRRAEQVELVLEEGVGLLVESHRIASQQSWRLDMSAMRQYPE